MADEPEAPHHFEPEEDEGGPVKSFLEHLEDLRWVLIKTGVAAGVAMLVCLLGGNYVVKVLEWPLSRAPLGPTGHSVQFFLGTNHLGDYQFSTNDPLASLAGTNALSRFQIAPVTIGTNQVLAVTPITDSNGAIAMQNQKLPIEIMTFGPVSAFMVATKVAFYAGIVISAPFIFYFIAQFVFPALRMREKKYVYSGLAFGAGLFLTGVCFCYFVLMPVALAASTKYATWLGFSSNQWRAEDYIGFVCKFMLGMGLGFELPVVVLTLVKIGVLSYSTLASARRYVIVISFLLGAILTTPEVVTQVLMAIPLYMLYEVSVWIAWYWERKEKRRVTVAGEMVRGT
jgi:sec-independent protein translocase protein TatC